LRPLPPSHAQPQQLNYLAIQLPPEATSTLYVEGLPPDATEREVSHIFRRFEGAGFQSVRMRPIESNKNPGTNLFLCFAEFDNAHQATIAMYGLQGYRFDVKVEGSNAGIRISYAKSKGAPRTAGGGGHPPRALPPPTHQPSYERGGYHESRDSGGYAPRHEPDRGGRDDRYDHNERGGRGGYDDDAGRDDRYDDERYSRRGRDERYRDDYEDSERGDDDLFQRADGVSMQGITD